MSRSDKSIIREPGGPCNRAYPVTFLDLLRFRQPRKISQRDMQFLQRHCRAALTGEHDEPIRWTRDRGWLWVVCPDEKALEYISNRSDLTCTHFEPALNWFPETREEADRLAQWVWQHFVQLRHSGMTSLKFKTTFYTGQRKHKRMFAMYANRPCKLTRVSPCVHFEARFKGARAVRSIGIRSAGDIARFDHVAFWRDHLRLYAVDAERLARRLSNREQGRKRQKADVTMYGTFAYDRDRARANLIRQHCRYCDFDAWAQFVYDNHGNGDWLRPVEASGLLPS